MPGKTPTMPAEGETTPETVRAVAPPSDDARFVKSFGELRDLLGRSVFRTERLEGDR